MGETYYSDADFWQKINACAKKAGRKVVEKALQLYYAATSKETPTWAKGVVWGALTYFIAPVDAIPDVVPFAGFADDWGVLLCAIGTVAAHITPKVKKKASEKMKEWFDQET